MSKLLSTHYSDGAFNFGALLLRLTSGGLILPIGYNKLTHFMQMKAKFGSFFGMSPTVGFSLLVFAEFFCALFIILGLGTRLAAVPLVIAMAVATFKAHHGEIFGDGGHAFMFMMMFLVILIIGPGKMSVDGAMGN